jgi:hypothetical protein
MNDQIRKLAIDAGLINYIDNETPRHYFVDASAEIQDVEKFAELIVKECVEFVEQDQGSGEVLSNRLKKHFGVE